MFNILGFTYVERLWMLAAAIVAGTIWGAFQIMHRNDLEANYVQVRGTVIEASTTCILREKEYVLFVIRYTRETHIPCEDANDIRAASAGGHSRYRDRILYKTKLTYSYVSPVRREVFLASAATNEYDFRPLRRGDTVMIWAHNTTPDRSEYAGRVSGR